MLKPLEILEKFGPKKEKGMEILKDHSLAVAGLAEKISKRLGLGPEERQFVFEASLLHDIGIAGTDAPVLFCTGNAPYIHHGLIGRKTLENLGLFDHARVALTHIGVGITCDDVKTQRLGLPEQDMVPVSLEEKIICFADKYFSKNPENCNNQKKTELVVKEIGNFGQEKVDIFLEWLNIFGEP